MAWYDLQKDPLQFPRLSLHPNAEADSFMLSHQQIILYLFLVSFLFFFFLLAYNSISISFLWFTQKDRLPHKTALSPSSQRFYPFIDKIHALMTVVDPVLWFCFVLFFQLYNN